MTFALAKKVTAAEHVGKFLRPSYIPAVRTKLGMFQVDWCPRSDVPSSEGQPKAKTPKRKRVAGGLVSRDIYRGSNVPSCVSGRTLITSHVARYLSISGRGESTKGGQTRYEVTWLPPTVDARLDGTHRSLAR